MQLLDSIGLGTIDDLFLDIPDAYRNPSLDLPGPMSELDIQRELGELASRNRPLASGPSFLGAGCYHHFIPAIVKALMTRGEFLTAYTPYQPEVSQGTLQVIFEFQTMISALYGMEVANAGMYDGATSLAEATLMACRVTGRNRLVVCDSVAPSYRQVIATYCQAQGFEVVTLPSDADGNTDLVALRGLLGDDLAGVMITLPSTLGLFDTNILEVCRLVHDCGGLVYGDGANMNALLGRAKLGALGFDVCHLNLHKTFSTPHGGGGPGAGPVCCGDNLAQYLAAPIVIRTDGGDYEFSEPAGSIGKISSFHGNFGVLVRAYTYIRTLGADGLRSISGNAVLNANYLMHSLKDIYSLPYDRTCMHEVVFSADWQRERGVSGLEVAKRLLDYGFHAPTMYFPLIVHEALMIEPTESENKDTLDAFIGALRAIDAEATSNPELVQNAPHTTPVARLDEATAARRPVLRWEPEAAD
ncbi:Probable glycine dehydrogenase (decarboxylating) subunit 2 [Geodia barretti]|uniref:glycine dehydrogenase (aminomethyl-transferring) n=1 Tax=Geodia barretti TaxID=519541 RepID=A0AA35QS99_GEOBA|nr:Probable glycine dehydrogenase (decarboxylating) subunit 2 [Geodia barretti]